MRDTVPMDSAYWNAGDYTGRAWAALAVGGGAAVLGLILFYCLVDGWCLPAMAASLCGLAASRFAIGGWRARLLTRKLAVPMVVLSSIEILTPAVVLIPSDWIHPTSMPQLTGNAALVVVHEALQRFRDDTGRFPTTEEGLDVLLAPAGAVPGSRGPYLTALPAGMSGAVLEYSGMGADLQDFHLTSFGGEDPFPRDELTE